MAWCLSAWSWASSARRYSRKEASRECCDWRAANSEERETCFCSKREQICSAVMEAASAWALTDLTQTPSTPSPSSICMAPIPIVMEDESASYVHGGLALVANVQNIAIDTKSPFYLHPSDHPVLIFVTQPLSENGENYFTWRRNMLTALQSKNKAGFVDGLIAKPDVHSGDFQSWIQCNAVVKSWIVNSLSRELQTGAAHADTASEIWCDFDERFT
ncbi:hypothetical protein RJ639_010762 [Escallonia herrerae]|uniref:Retrotransposon Copia-like N-terminal domain-containing protein n=1 Tax=Escallonia herrerae TaxID=1293975 RepID=A0AA88VL90_9ASTE|nr:hypothetical protein RJ639_010762 [Escallonia herrerae]